jgi:glutathione S-transferase
MNNIIYMYTAAVTLLALLLLQVLTIIVAQARVRHGIKAPAVTGSEQFERAHRVHMNTVEQMAFFLPAMWLCAGLLSDGAAAAGGLIWVIGRAIYAASYLNDPAKRGPGAYIAFLAQLALWFGATAGLVHAAIKLGPWSSGT